MDSSRCFGRLIGIGYAQETHAIFLSHFGKKQWKCEHNQLWNWIIRISLLADKVVSRDDRFDDPEHETYLISIDGVDMKAWEKNHSPSLRTTSSAATNSQVTARFDT
jgi:hypothetical protein